MQWVYVIGAFWMSCVGYMVGHIHGVVRDVNAKVNDILARTENKTQDSEKIL